MDDELSRHNSQVNNEIVDFYVNIKEIRGR